MGYRGANETLRFLAMIVFFGGGLLLCRAFIPVNSNWDYVLLQLLTMMSGLGLCITVMLWVFHIFDKRDEAQAGLPIKLSRNMQNKCG